MHSSTSFRGAVPLVSSQMRRWRRSTPSSLRLPPPIAIVFCAALPLPPSQISFLPSSTSAPPPPPPPPHISFWRRDLARLTHSHRERGKRSMMHRVTAARRAACRGRNARHRQTDTTNELQFCIKRATPRATIKMERGSRLRRCNRLAFMKVTWNSFRMSREIG